MRGVVFHLLCSEYLMTPSAHGGRSVNFLKAFNVSKEMSKGDVDAAAGRFWFVAMVLHRVKDDKERAWEAAGVLSGLSQSEGGGMLKTLWAKTEHRIAPSVLKAAELYRELVS